MAATSQNGNSSRLAKKYLEQVLPALQKEFDYANINQTPAMVKTTLNVGVGEAVQNVKVLEAVRYEIERITGQHAVITRAKKSIASFKVREGMPIGMMVTLRRSRMWHFLDKLFSIVLPQVRDFRGVRRRSFDGNGNYTIGLREQLVFPELDFDNIEKVRGMNITLHTTAGSDEEGLRLLELLGLPFRK